jgi:hypothetical protein
MLDAELRQCSPLNTLDISKFSNTSKALLERRQNANIGN